MTKFVVEFEDPTVTRSYLKAVLNNCRTYPLGKFTVTEATDQGEITDGK